MDERMNGGGQVAGRRAPAVAPLPLQIPGLYLASNFTLRQLRFWLLQSSQPELPVERFLRVILLADPLAEHLEAVWNWFSAAADATRARLLVEEGVPMLRFESAAEPLQRAALSEGDDPAAAIVAWAEATDWTVFRAGDLLHRHALVTMADGRKLWAMTSNHLVNDGRGGNVMFRIMAAGMEALARGERLPPLQMVSFEKNMAAERETGRAISVHGQPWEELPQLKPLPFSLFGLEENTRSNRKPLGQANVQAGFMSDLVRLCEGPGYFHRSTAATLANVFTALAAVWVWRHGGQREVIIGIPFHGRSGEEHNMVGFKSEIVPVQIRVDPGQTFPELLQNVHATVRNALSRRGGSVANPAHAPAYRVVVSFNHELDRKPEANHLMRRIQVAKQSSTPEMVNLEIVNADGDDGEMHLLLRARQEYAELTDIQWLAAGIQEALFALVEHPAMPIRDLHFRDPESSKHLRAIEQVALTEVPTDWLSRWYSSLDLIGDQAALRHGDVVLTHSQLAAAAERWRGHLRNKGLRRGDRVLVWSRPSHAVSCAWLALMGSGGVYVPVHHGTPAQKIDELARRLHARFILHEPELVPDQPSGDVICLRLDDPDVVTYPPERLVDPRPEDPAHILHTSGSTGTAKAIEVDHGALSASIRGWIDANGMQVGERIFHFYSITFDPWLTGIMPALWLGGVCVTPELDRPPSADELQSMLGSGRITSLCTPTAYFHALCDLVAPPSLRRWIVGGEALAADKALRFLVAQTPGNGVRLMNAYGPTETTIWACVHEVNATHAPGAPALPVPIGAPSSTCGFRVADADGAASPLGVPGELWICGPQVAIGYAGQPELTAQQFVERDGCRWYRTGDVVRLRKDGRFDYLGREDRQVQVRGHRVEPAEIEIVLRGVDGIRDALVLPVSMASTTSLCAYLMLEADRQELNASALRIELLRHLPEYKVPRWFVPVDGFPANHNGKVDVSALPAPSGRESETAADRLPTLTLWDLRFAFEEVLDMPRVRVDDDFFELGGDSLLLVELIAAIERRFGRRLDPVDIVQHPTIGGLAPLLETCRPSVGNPVVVLKQGPDSPLFCIPGAGGIGIEFYALSRRLPRDQPVVVLRSSGTDGHSRAPASANALLEEHVEHLLAYRAREGDERPVHLMGYSLGGIFAFEVAKRLQARGITIARLYLIDAHVATPEGRRLSRQPALRLRRRVRTLLSGTPDEQERITLQMELDAAIAAGRIMDAARLGRYNLLSQAKLAGEIQSSAAVMPATYFLASRGPRRQHAGLWKKLIPDLRIEIIDGDHQGDDSIVREPGVAALGDVVTGLLN